MFAKRIRVEGKVQGVGFRAAAVEQARNYPSLSGLVWNTRDGAVEVFVQGERAEVLAFMQWCYEGPPTARVQGLESENVEPSDKPLEPGLSTAPDQDPSMG